MSSVRKPDPITGTIRQPLGTVLIAGIPLFGFFAGVALLFPSYSRIYLYFTLTLGLLGVVSLIWINIRPNLWAKFLLHATLTSLFTIIAVRTFNGIFINFQGKVGFFIILTVLFFHSLPLWNIKATRFLRGELSYQPTSRLGKFMLKMSLALLPIAGLVGAIIGTFVKGDAGGIDTRLLVLAPLCWYLAILLPFSTPHAVSPWESKKNTN